MIKKHWQIFYNGVLACRTMSKMQAERKIGVLVLDGWTGKFELKEGACL